MGPWLPRAQKPNPKVVFEKLKDSHFYPEIAHFITKYV